MLVQLSVNPIDLDISIGLIWAGECVMLLLVSMFDRIKTIARYELRTFRRRLKWNAACNMNDVQNTLCQTNTTVPSDLYNRSNWFYQISLFRWLNSITVNCYGFFCRFQLSCQCLKTIFYYAGFKICKMIGQFI
jgi:hypothetical protein